VFSASLILASSSSICWNPFQRISACRRGAQLNTRFVLTNASLSFISPKQSASTLHTPLLRNKHPSFTCHSFPIDLTRSLAASSLFFFFFFPLFPQSPLHAFPSACSTRKHSCRFTSGGPNNITRHDLIMSVCLSHITFIALHSPRLC
jgi:hypothetical protein